MTDGLKVTYAELGVRDGSSPTVSLDMETMTTGRTLIFNWTDLPAALWQLIGYSWLDDAYKLHRYLPEEDKRFPGLWASKIGHANGIAWLDKYIAEFGSLNNFKKAAIQVDYFPRPYSILADADVGGNEFLRFVEVETSIEGQYLSINDGLTGVMHYTEGANSFATVGSQGSLFPGTTGKIVCEENYHFLWHQIPDLGLPETAMLATIGKTNKTAFGDPTLDRLYFPAGNLLLLGASWRRIFMYTPEGVKPAWTIEYTAKYNRNGHNRIFDWHANQRSWVRISSNGTDYPPGSVPDGKCIYDEQEYADLFNTAA